MELDYGKISIILPVYNVDEYLNQCLESLQKQTYKNIEVIMIDDGSKDKSGLICDNWQKKDKRFRVIHKKNEGLSKARNIGIKYASGKWIMFVDSDDWVTEDFCLDAIKTMNEENADICVFNFIMYWNDDKYVKCNEFQKRCLDSERAIRKLVCGELENYAWNKIYKKELFKGVKYPEGKLWEDIGTTYKLFLNANKVSFCEKYNYYYRQNRVGSISLAKEKKGYLDLYEQYCEQLTECCKKYPDLYDHINANKNIYAFLVAMKFNFELLKLPQYTEIDKVLNSNKIKTFPINRNKKLLLIVYRISPKLFFLLCKILYLMKGNNN